MSIDAYLARIKNRQERQRTEPGLSYPAPGNSENFQLAQGKAISISIPEWQVRCVAITNLTPFFVHFPDNPAEFQWVPPNTIGAVYPVPPTGPIRINAVDVPGGLSVPSSSLIAQLTAHEDALPASAGAPFASAATAVAPNLSPNQKPQGFSTGNMAGQSGVNLIPPVVGQVIYLFDYEIYRLDATANGVDPELGLLDGISGAVIWIGHIGTGTGRVGGGSFSGAATVIDGGSVTAHNYDTVIHAFDINLTWSQA